MNLLAMMPCDSGYKPCTNKTNNYEIILYSLIYVFYVLICSFVCLFIYLVYYYYYFYLFFKTLMKTKVGKIKKNTKKWAA